jgi:hypothetical protein
MVTCEAFPEGIPLLILYGIFDHHHPFDMLEMDDNGLMYVPKS